MQLEDVVSLDVETTTWDVEKAQVVQIGKTSCHPGGAPFSARQWWKQYINPGDEALSVMGPDVIAITGLSPSFIRRAGKLPALVRTIYDLKSDRAVCGHNFVNFDLRVLANTGFDYSAVPIIDTYRVVQEFYRVGDWDREARVLPNMKLGTCYYGILPESKWEMDVPGRAHDALYDAVMTAKLLEQLVEDLDVTVDSLIELSATPFVPRECWLGKHKGSPWDVIPEGYLRWMANNAVWDSDAGRETAVLSEMDRRGMID